jgi:hypothetical protein
MHAMADDKESLRNRVTMALKIAKAVMEFHEGLKMGHGVLNPRNIMFDQAENVVLTGFGMESLKKYLSLTNGYCNMSFYTAV